MMQSFFRPPSAAKVQRTTNNFCPTIANNNLKKQKLTSLAPSPSVVGALPHGGFSRKGQKRRTLEQLLTHRALSPTTKLKEKNPNRPLVFLKHHKFTNVSIPCALSSRTSHMQREEELKPTFLAISDRNRATMESHRVADNAQA